MLKLAPSKAFEKDVAKAKKRNKDLSKLYQVIVMLQKGETLPPKYKDHPLKGNYKGYRDCHVEPDWILIYKIDQTLELLALTRTGTHSDLF